MALQYLTRLSVPDAERIENEIIECELVSNRQAESIYNLPLKLQLPNASAVQNRIASKYGKSFVSKDKKIILKILSSSITTR